MPNWLPPVLNRVANLAHRRRVQFTLKATRERNALGLGIAEACGILAGMTVEDSAGRIVSRVTGEWMYVFKPLVADSPIYVNVVLRRDCIVVSFHEDEGHERQEDG